MTSSKPPFTRFLFLILILTTKQIFGQDSPAQKLIYVGWWPMDSTGPRAKIDHDKTGHYEMIVQVEKTELNKGETLNLRVYISGYGLIGASKIWGGIPSNLIDGKYSYAKFGLNPNIRDMWWGSQTDTLLGSNSLGGFELNMKAFKSATWKYSTPYIDYNQDRREKHDTQNFRILTEINLKTHLL